MPRQRLWAQQQLWARPREHHGPLKCCEGCTSSMGWLGCANQAARSFWNLGVL
jgi:hypothetical protein